MGRPAARVTELGTSRSRSSSSSARDTTRGTSSGSGREVCAVAHLRGEHVVRVPTSACFAGDRPFLVME